MSTVCIQAQTKVSHSAGEKNKKIVDHASRDGWKRKKKKRATPHILSLLKNPPVNFSWLYLLRDLSVWFNVRLTVIGFWCLPLITSENWGGQFTLRMHIKRHQKLRSWRPGNIIKAFYNAAPCIIAYAFFVCVRACVWKGGWQAFWILSVFSVFRLTYFRESHF